MITNLPKKNCVRVLHVNTRLDLLTIRLSNFFILWLHLFVCGSHFFICLGCTYLITLLIVSFGYIKVLIIPILTNLLKITLFKFSIIFFFVPRLIFSYHSLISLYLDLICLYLGFISLYFTLIWIYLAPINLYKDFIYSHYVILLSLSPNAYTLS